MVIGPCVDIHDIFRDSNQGASKGRCDDAEAQEIYARLENGLVAVWLD